MPTPAHFNQAMDIKLIRLVRDHDVLYNTKHPKHSDCYSREVIWQRIGESLNRPARICKSRWVNIRDQMRKKVRDRRRKPQQNLHKYKYEHELTFMLSDLEDSRQSEEYLDLDVDSDVHSEILYVSNPEFEDEEKPLVTIQNSNDSLQMSHTPHSSNFGLSSLDPADPIDVFLMTVGSTLRKFTPYYLNQAKSKIFQVVQDYELQQIVNKDDLPGSSVNN